MQLPRSIFVLPLMLLIALASGAPDEAMGRENTVYNYTILVGTVIADQVKKLCK